MNFPPPTPQQARILWISVTALSIGVLLLLVGLLAWGMGWVAQQLSAVLLPLAIAGIIAYLLDPVVDFFERKGMSRTRSIISVFVLAVLLVGLFLSILIPQLVSQVGDLVDKFPNDRQEWTTEIERVLEEQAGKVAQLRGLWERHGETIKNWATEKVPELSAQVPVAAGWALGKLTTVASWLGLLVGLALIPVYVFYFLLEKRGISSNWTNYMPIQQPEIKRELVFFVQSVNDSMIVFFRGQVLVALCVGALTAIGFMVIGLNYGLLLGVMTGVLGIIPYLGVMMSFLPAILIGVIQFNDWRVLLVVAVFAAVQALEGLVISPKIIGDRVGMHPLTIIVAVMVGTTLMGGIIGGILAIPLTAVLRAVMFRYVWKRKNREGATETAAA